MNALPRINLLPAAVRTRRARSRAGRLWLPVNLALVGVFGAAFLSGGQAGLGAGVDEGILALEHQLGVADAAIAEAEGVIRDTENQLATSAALSDNPDWGVVIQLLGRLAGERVEYQAIEIRPAPPPEPEGRTRRSRRAEPEHRLVAEEMFVVRIDAVCDGNIGVSEYVLRLIDAPLFEDVRLASSRRQTDDDGNETYRFQINARVAAGPAPEGG